MVRTNDSLCGPVDLSVISAGGCAALAHYTARQLRFISPGASVDFTVSLLANYIPAALRRFQVISEHVTSIEPGTFDPIHSSQYATYLYLLANDIFVGEGDNVVSEQLFLLNRCLNGIDLYYKVRMPPVFAIGHGLGAVLSNSVYGNNFVFFQNCTIGRLGMERPVIGENVILFPGSGVFGGAKIGDNSIISAGTIVNGEDIPHDSMVFGGRDELIIKKRRKDYIQLYIRQAPTGSKR